MSSDDGEARPGRSRARETLRQVIASKVAEAIRGDPERAADAIELGLIDARWLDDPGQRPLTTSTKSDILRRYLERSVERHPSTLGSLGLSALELLALEGERPGEGAIQRITIAFTDLEGFTQFTSDSGDDAAIALLSEHQRIVGPIVRSRGGRIVKRLGDGLMLAFPEPEAAIFAVLALVDAPPPPLRLRAGLHVGDAVVTRDDLLGHVVNVAARVAALAEGGATFATCEVRDAVGALPGVQFGRARRVKLKGIPDRVAICPVTGN